MATNTHSKYVTLIAFPLQPRLQEHASMLRYTQIDGLVIISRHCEDGRTSQEVPRIFTKLPSTI